MPDSTNTDENMTEELHIQLAIISATNKAKHDAEEPMRKLQAEIKRRDGVDNKNAIAVRAAVIELTKVARSAGVTVIGLEHIRDVPLSTLCDDLVLLSRAISAGKGRLSLYNASVSGG